MGKDNFKVGDKVISSFFPNNKATISGMGGFGLIIELEEGKGIGRLLSHNEVLEYEIKEYKDKPIYWWLSDTSSMKKIPNKKLMIRDMV